MPVFPRRVPDEGAVVPLRPARRDGSIGSLLVGAGKLSPDKVEQIRDIQERRGLRFGEAALDLGVVSSDDISHALSAQFEYPYLSPGESEVSEDVIAAYQPFAAEVEALRDLRSQLVLAWPESLRGTRIIAITSPGRREGRSYLAANLAVVFSQLGERTLLIDADMRNPSQHQFFGMANRTGLSSVLSGRNEADVILPVAAFPELNVLPAGGTPPNPQELVGRRAFRHLLDEYAAEYDAIIVDTPALECGADAQIIAARTRAALVIARQDRTRVQALDALKGAFKRAGVSIVGTALTRF